MELKSVTLPNCGYRVCASSFPETVKWLLDRMEAGKPTAVYALNPLKIERAEREEKVKEALLGAELLIPDGTGVLWAAKKCGCPIPERITGVDLMEKICAAAAERGYTIFLYGSTDEHLEKAERNLRERYPGIRVGGRQNGYTDDTDAVLRKINESGAEILFVAMGSPKQELFLHKYRHRLPKILLMQGVGGSVDVLSGEVRRAPRFICRLRLEWLWRILSQPKRLPQLPVLFRFYRRFASNKNKNR